MKRVLIVGAGGFGRELYFWLQQHPESHKSWVVSGFLDDNPAALDGLDFPLCILDSISGYVPEDADLLVCALGLPRTKRKVCEALRARGATFLTFIHPSVVLGGKILLGEGVVLCPGVILTSCIRLHDFVMLNCHSSAGHDVEIGAFSSISGHCDLTGGGRVGSDVFMGSGASLIPGTRVGDGATVGAGAVVIRSVSAGTTVFGNPAKVLPR